MVRIPEGVLLPAEVASGRKYVIRYGPYLDAFRLVLKDVRAKNLQFKAVVNLSSGMPNLDGKIPEAGDDDWELYEVVRELINENVVIVTGSGNSGTFTRKDPTQPPNKVRALDSGSCHH